MLRAALLVGVLAAGTVFGATRVLGHGTAATVPSASSLAPHSSARPAPSFGPQAVPAGGPSDPAGLLAQLLVTYAPGSACATVAVTTPVDKVPPACAVAWASYHVRVVPGQDAMKRTPRFPQVSAGPGVTPQEAMKLAVALWRTKTFQAFALATRQLPIEEGLSRDDVFLRAGSEEIAAEKGEQVTTPLCHFFATQLRVVVLAPDLQGYMHRAGRVLGVKARFLGPCFATAVDSSGAKHQVFSFDGTDDAVFVGDVGAGDPLGAVLNVTGIGDCSADISKATCAA